MAVLEIGTFKISPLHRPSGKAERFHSNKMKDDMKEAIGRLGAGYKFSYKSKQGTIVDGKQRGSRRELGLRIHIQEYFMETINDEDRQIANVQIQLNGEKRHRFTFSVEKPFQESSYPCIWEKFWDEKDHSCVYIVTYCKDQCSKFNQFDLPDTFSDVVKVYIHLLLSNHYWLLNWCTLFTNNMSNLYKSAYLFIFSLPNLELFLSLYCLLTIFIFFLKRPNVNQTLNKASSEKRHYKFV